MELLLREINRKKLKKLARAVKRCPLNRRAVKRFATITGDTQILHQDSSYAQKRGLFNVPVMGTHLSALGYKVASMLEQELCREKIITQSSARKCVEHEIYLKQPIFLR